MVNRKSYHQTIGSSGHVQCPFCAAMNEASIHNEDETLHILSRKEDTLKPVIVTVPVWTCTLCSESWTDYVADDVRFQALKEFM